MEVLDVSSISAMNRSSEHLQTCTSREKMVDTSPSWSWAHPMAYRFWLDGAEPSLLKVSMDTASLKDVLPGRETCALFEFRISELSDLSVCHMVGLAIKQRELWSMEQG